MISNLELEEDELGALFYQAFGMEGSHGERALSHLFHAYVGAGYRTRTTDTGEAMFRLGQRDLILSIYEVLDNYKKSQNKTTQPEV